jgi:hypothetical protein
MAPTAPTAPTHSAALAFIAIEDIPLGREPGILTIRMVGSPSRSADVIRFRARVLLPTPRLGCGLFRNAVSRREMVNARGPGLRRALAKTAIS